MCKNIAKVVLGERFLIPGGDHSLTPFDLELSVSRIRSIVGAGVPVEDIVIVFLGNGNPFSMLFSWICVLRESSKEVGFV